MALFSHPEATALIAMTHRAAAADIHGDHRRENAMCASYLHVVLRHFDEHTTLFRPSHHDLSCFLTVFFGRKDLASAMDRISAIACNPYAQTLDNIIKAYNEQRELFAKLESIEIAPADEDAACKRAVLRMIRKEAHPLIRRIHVSVGNYKIKYGKL